MKLNTKVEREIKALNFRPEHITEHGVTAKMMLDAVRSLALATQLSSKHGSVRSTLEWLLDTVDSIESNLEDGSAWEILYRGGMDKLSYAFSLLNVPNPTDAVIEHAVDLLEETICDELYLLSVGC